MTKISFHASHEQFKPGKLLELAVMAEQAGFDGVLSSDHFSPWNNQQGESGFAWSWLGAALAKTNISFGVVNAPGQRYHPAIIAQAGATLAEMFPGRFWIALGSGQALNEHITGTYWPNKQERNERLRECVDIIRALWEGESVNHVGLVTVEDAMLYTLPDNPPLIAGAAITEETASWIGSWADGLITISHPIGQLKKMIEAFREGGGEGKKLILKVQLSYDKTDEKAMQGAFDQWKTNIFKSNMLAELRTPGQFQEAAEFLDPQVMQDHVNISSNPAKHIEWINEYISLGFDEIVLHNVNTNQEQFIDIFGSRVLPELDFDN
jgi:coenzyme F420-dependent glucose-6-phosphate dehydrogenase